MKKKRKRKALADSGGSLLVSENLILKFFDHRVFCLLLDAAMKKQQTAVLYLKKRREIKQGSSDNSTQKHNPDQPTHTHTHTHTHTPVSVHVLTFKNLQTSYRTTKLCMSAHGCSLTQPHTLFRQM